MFQNIFIMLGVQNNFWSLPVFSHNLAESAAANLPDRKIDCGILKNLEALLKPHWTFWKQLVSSITGINIKVRPESKREMRAIKEEICKIDEKVVFFTKRQNSKLLLIQKNKRAWRLINPHGFYSTLASVSLSDCASSSYDWHSLNASQHLGQGRCPHLV